MRFRFLFATLLASQPAEACHRFSRWYYPYPQRCSTAHQAEPDRSWFVEFVLPEADKDIPLPSLEHMEFPADNFNDNDPRARLKGIGLLRELREREQ